MRSIASASFRCPSAEGWMEEQAGILPSCMYPANRQPRGREAGAARHPYQVPPSLPSGGRAPTPRRCRLDLFPLPFLQLPGTHRELRVDKVPDPPLLGLVDVLELEEPAGVVVRPAREVLLDGDQHPHREWDLQEANAAACGRRGEAAVGNGGGPCLPPCLPRERALARRGSRPGLYRDKDACAASPFPSSSPVFGS